MPKLSLVDWKTLEKVFLANGFQFVRSKGSHRAYSKPGISRPVIIPTYDEIGIDIIKSNLRTAEISRDQYFELLKQV